MKLEKLFEIQKALDDKILMEHQLQKQDLVPPKLLALQVELGELANETRCFKYWSKKKPSEKKVILEEYVDCLHFILSLGLDGNFTLASTDFHDSGEGLVQRFQRVFTEINGLLANLEEGQYIALWESFMALGEGLGFSLEEIEEAYLLKNKINHQRQAEGY